MEEPTITPPTEEEQRRHKIDEEILRGRVRHLRREVGSWEELLAEYPENDYFLAKKVLAERDLDLAEGHFADFQNRSYG